MRDLTSPIFFATLALVAAVLLAGPSGSADSPPQIAGPPPTAPAPKKAAETSAYQLLSRHYGLDDVADPAAIRAALERDRLKVVIASVPDPVDSHFAFAFDAHVDALTRAAVGSGHTPESWTFPWPVQPEEEIADLGEQPGDARRTATGAMLFVRNGRAATEPNELLLMLLVGEAPTFGVHPEALVTALNTFQALAPAQKKLSFAGPCYSGSAPRLRTLVLKWAEQRTAELDVAFVTGSATAEGVVQVLEDVGHDVQPSIRLHAHRLTHDDPRFLAAFQSYLAAIRSDTAFASLAERGTVYAQQLSATPDVATRPTPPADPGSPGAGSVPADAPSAIPLERSYTFPLHLAQLRAASERREGTAAAQQRPSSPFGRSALGLVLDKDRTAVDVPPPYSPKESANVVELELEATLESLRRQEIGHLLLTATDVRDQLFLAQLLGRFAPSAHLVSFGSDVLYNHPRFSRDLLGMKVVSSYPLTAKLPAALQLWSGAPENHRDTFPSSAIEGTYRAALLAIAGPDACSDAHASPLLPCSWMHGSSPPVWVSAVGRDGMWPVWIDGGEGKALEAADLYALRPPSLFRILLIFAIIGVACVALAYLLRWDVAPLRLEPGARQTGRWEPSVLRWLLLPPADGDRDGRSRRAIRFLFLLAVLILSSLPPIVALQGLRAVDLGAWHVYKVECALLAVSALLVLPATVHALLSLLDGWRHGKRAPRKSMRIATACGALGIALALGLASLVFGDGSWRDGVNWALFSHRLSHLESGLSPLVPIALQGLGLMVMLLVFARRVQLLSMFNRIRPLESPASLSAQPVHAATSRLLASEIAALRAELKPTGQLRLGPPVIALSALVLVPGYFFLQHLSLSVDGSLWKWLFAAGSLLLVSQVVISLLGFLGVWREMRKVTRTLAASPLRDAFRRLPERFGRSVGFEPAAAPVLLSELQYSVNQLRLLDARFPGLPERPGLFDGWVSGREQPGNAIADELIREEAQSGRARRPGVLSHTQELLSAASRRLQHVLERRWAQAGAIVDDPEPAPVVTDDALKRERAGRAPSTEQFWFELAEEFVAAQLTAFLSFVFIYLRASLMGTTLAFVLLVLAMTTYPFEPQVPVLNFLSFLIAVAVGLGLFTFVQASRNELLSLLEGTTPNQITWNGNLVMQIFTYGLVPLLAALSAQVPVLGHLVGTLFSAATSR